MDTDVTPIRREGISLEEMLERKRDCEFEYFGHTIRFSYWVEKVTHEFRADLLRMNRMMLRLEQKRNFLTNQIAMVLADADTAEAVVEDARAEDAIKQLDVEDATLKRQIDLAVAGILADWNVTSKGAPLAPSVENLSRIDSAFEGSMIGEILKDSAPMGEASGRQSSTQSPPSSKQKVSRLTRRANSSKHRAG